MSDVSLRSTIESLWDRRDSLNAQTKGADREAVEHALAGLEAGTLRTAEKIGADWVVNEWLKKAVLLSFRLYDSALMEGTGGAPVWDKVAMKFAGWDAEQFRRGGFRAVPGAIVRRSAYIAPDVVLMPSFVNVGEIGRAHV